MDQVLRSARRAAGLLSPCPAHPAVLEALEEAISLGAGKIWLSGSYLRGDWDDGSREEIKEYRKLVKRKEEPSDVDFITEPFVIGKKFDSLRAARQKLLIYDRDC